MSTIATTPANERHCDDSVAAAPNTLERHIADSLAAADAYDKRAMEAILDGDRAAADRHWDTASLLRVSAHLIAHMRAMAA